MATEIPPERLFDLFTRIDELLVLNVEATRKLTEAIEKLAGIPAAPPAAPPPRVIAAPPAPPELAPLAGRLDNLAVKLDGIRHLFEGYLTRGRGKPVALLERYSGSDQTYQELVTWRVGDLWGLSRGQIEEISVVSNNYTKTEFKLTVEGKALFKDRRIQSSLSLPFPSHEIPRGEEIKLEVRSTDGTAIVVDGTITGREY